MTSPIESQRKVRRLENDVTSIYELLDSIQKTQHKHGDQLERIGAQVATIEGAQLQQGTRLDSIEATQLQHGSRLASIDARLEGVDARLDGIDTRFDGLETRFDGLETRFDGLDEKMDAVLEILRPDDARPGPAMGPGRLG